LGISGAYLAAARPDSSFVTLEGNPSISQIAAETFRMLNLKNIRQVTGKFDNTLSDVISSAPPSDLVFIDGNHRKEPTLKYFRQFLNKKSADSIFIFHDIHWSREMEEAWRIIRDHQEVMLTIDLFSAGFIFFGESFRVKQDFIIRF
jgi:predicted O-methyltransferase YrrM